MEAKSPLKFTVLTIFPQIIHSYFSVGVLKRAIERSCIAVDTVDYRDFSANRYRSVDDEPFGGGAGMVLTPEPVALAVESVGPVAHRVMLSPNGRPFTQRDAERWSKFPSLLLLCGRYEGIDERAVKACTDEAISVGDYVISGGELAALTIIDATARMVPGVLGNAASAGADSFSDGLLEHPHYTRPSTWRGIEVPKVLLSGHHARISQWRREMSLRRTAECRPELLESASLSAVDLVFLDALDRAADEEST